MYMSRYSFDGDPTDLEHRYHQFVSGMPAENIELQVVIRRPDGLDVYDSCPTREEFLAFSASAEFAAAIAGVGLPVPRVEGLGDIAHVVVKEAVR